MRRARVLRALIVGLMVVPMITSAVACKKSEEAKTGTEAATEAETQTGEAPEQPAPTPEQKPET